MKGVSRAHVVGLLSLAIAAGSVIAGGHLYSCTPRAAAALFGSGSGEQVQPRARQVLLKRAAGRLQSALAQKAVPDTPASLLVPARIVAGYYHPSYQDGLQSLQNNAAALTHLLPQWLRLNSSGRAVDYRDWDPVLNGHNMEAVWAAQKARLQIHPVLSNSTRRGYDPQSVARLFASVGRQRLLALRLRGWLLRRGFHGLQIDFQELGAAERRYLPAFLRRLSAALTARRLTLSVALQPGVLTPPALQMLARWPEFLVIRGFDEHTPRGKSGPLASQRWYEEILERYRAILPPYKLVMALGSYGCDWAGPGRSVLTTYLGSMEAARRYLPRSEQEAFFSFEPPALNTHFSYVDDRSQSHTVWLLDAASFHNQLLVARRAGLRGWAVWVLGAEDPGIWNLLHPDAGSASLDGTFEKIPSLGRISFDGRGEVLSVHSTPLDGRRSITEKNSAGLITGVRYQQLPAPFIIRRSGFVPNALALTFDDGPDPVYTPLILDALQREGVPATFFVVGREAARRPDILRRMWSVGHEIGSHSFTHGNLSAFDEQRRQLEFNATQRVIEGVLGRSPRLFRTPYNSDARPSAGEDLLPLLTASRLDYLVVGGLIDPQDWNRNPAAEISRRVVKLARAGAGNIIVLHDGGGDRRVTADALPMLIRQLKKEGYRFVTVSELMGASRNEVMPATGRIETAAAE